MYQRAFERKLRGRERPPRKISDVLPSVTKDIGKIYRSRGGLILASWSRLVPKQFSKLTSAERFSEGILYVTVRHSSLLSLFVHHEKKRLLVELQRSFPEVSIEDIRFRIG